MIEPSYIAFNWLELQIRSLELQTQVRQGKLDSLDVMMMIITRYVSISY